MALTEIQAKSILIKQKKIDSWFISAYGMNLYRGCLHNCVYCDGRSERYRLNGVFGEDIEIKKNAAELLTRALNPRYRRKPLKRAFILLGGGVNDSYQAIEKKYQLSRKALEILKFYKYPVHILTKSELVLRDLDLIKEIDKRTKGLVSFSFSSVDSNISRIFEPKASSPAKRLKAISVLKSEGISTGAFLMPLIPFISDSEEKIDQSIAAIQDAGADYIVFGGMTLKQGAQQDHYYNILEKYDPGLINTYKKIYKGDYWGNASSSYYKMINKRFDKIATKYQVSKRIPLSVFASVLDADDRVKIALEHLAYIYTLKNRKVFPHTLLKNLNGNNIDRISDLQNWMNSWNCPEKLKIELENIYLKGASDAFEAWIKS